MDKKLQFLVFFVITGIFVCFLSIFAIVYAFHYFTYEKEADKELWISEGGKEACIPLRIIQEKDFEYTELLCNDGTKRMEAKGSQGFKVIRP
ncbi:MAG: hypothetical protein LBU76_02735 [Azoarcus sp.]|jgi:hypothetical protein|nr:hypothetical protein [Azoarcus sp.]